MNIRQQKVVVLVAAGVVVSAMLLGVGLAVQNGKGIKDAGLPGLILLLMITGVSWSQLRKLEAEHGPDYEPPPSKNARTVLLVAVAAAAVLAAIAVWLVAR